MPAYDRSAVAFVKLSLGGGCCGRIRQTDEEIEIVTTKNVPPCVAAAGNPAPMIQHLVFS
ncbi:hypothetical protein EJ066_16770 [Mesorhizobium sp. M9A.F.Ca.ET.002.03.1.2]|uniref:hypothetical protein n=1 Tax=Mesorhizobium sp. M9A.F.Ca.ET.002.03.1.2 TaxID=2493668 RepID=UPI000F75B16C|nr:hypothetical protein [Mesorhizobium sp. M9A.F.Ca.ET.002.03.1.2]AZN98683.1 hypothetical protein EJ066_16770 [Mesorhizobium sp. M9A.F.Ca.ET.002.03.1.2]